MHTQSQWGWGKHSGRAVVEPQFELAGVKTPRILRKGQFLINFELLGQILIPRDKF